MNPSDPEMPLRLAPVETPEELAHRFEREQRAAALQRESQMDHSLAPYRVGSVPFLNGAPLVRGLEDQVQYHPPSRLAEMLQHHELDAALVSLTEVLVHPDYDILEGVAIASLGEVKSVLLAHQRPLAELKRIYCDPASLTSVQLLKVLLAEQGLHPEYVALPDYRQAHALEAVLLIGDEALNFIWEPHSHEIWDLGAAWFELTHLPFVYAVWALQRQLDTSRLRQLLREARHFGLETLDAIIANRTEYSFDFRKDYLSWHIHYHLGADEQRGIARFIELLRKHQLGPVHEPRWIK
jgi:chorismate dehydratase